MNTYNIVRFAYTKQRKKLVRSVFDVKISYEGGYSIKSYEGIEWQEKYSREREEKAVSITSLILHKHYCENDVEAVIGYFDEPFMWLGAGEAEYAVGRDKAREIFRKLAGMVPRCNLSDEEYNACMLSPDICMVTGRVWISTAPEEGIALRVHQRITTVFRWRDDTARRRCTTPHPDTAWETRASSHVTTFPWIIRSHHPG